MCNWHKYAIREAATDPATGQFDPAKYALGVTLMAGLRIEQERWHLPALYEIDGFNPEELLTPEAQAAFAASGLGETLEDAKSALDRDIEALRALMTECVDGGSRLHIPDHDHITKEGYKQTCCAPPDPRDNGPFLNAAVVYLYKGYDDAARSYASGDLTLLGAEELKALPSDPSVPEKDRPWLSALEELRATVGDALDRPGVKALLEDTFRHSVSYLFLTAQSDLEAHKGLSSPSHCVMCQSHAPEAEVIEVKTHEAVKEAEKPSCGGECHCGGDCSCGSRKRSLTDMFCQCACTAGPAAGGALLSHAGCILATVFAGFSGAATGMLMHAAMYAVSPLIAAGAAMGVGHWKGEGAFSRQTLTHAGISATIALAVTFGINALGGGHEGHHHGDHHAHTPEAAEAWFEHLPADDRHKIEDIAGRAGVAPHDYVFELQGIPTLSDGEKQSLRDVVGKTCPCQVPGACKIQGLTP